MSGKWRYCCRQGSVRRRKILARWKLLLRPLRLGAAASEGGVGLTGRPWARGGPTVRRESPSRCPGRPSPGLQQGLRLLSGHLERKKAPMAADSEASEALAFGKTPTFGTVVEGGGKEDGKAVALVGASQTLFACVGRGKQRSLVAPHPFQGRDDPLCQRPGRWQRHRGLLLLHHRTPGPRLRQPSFSTSQELPLRSNHHPNGFASLVPAVKSS
jgi:hypothetical protein